MFDSEIQSAKREVLEGILKRIGPYPQNAGEIDLAIRIAKELRHRNKFKKAVR